MKTLLDREDLVFNPPQLGCVLYLPGLPGGSRKIYDRSPYGNHGTIVGATWVRLPSGLWVLSFDGQDDHITCPVITFTADLTLIAWAKATDWTPNLHKNIVNSWSLPANADWYKLGIQANNTLAFIVDAGDDDGGKTELTVAHGFDDGSWHLLAGVRDTGASKVYLYADGSEVNNMAHPDATALIPTANEIGCRGDATTEFWDGIIALPRFFNRALSALEIQNHFNREKHLFGVWSR